DTLFLYTDGLTEAFSSDGDLFGDARLMDSLKSSAQALTADVVIMAVENRLNEFIESVPLADDLTMLVIRMV
ncbi:MAG: SpoIIE family protein phosphatase, partial [Anaerolineales bacterium]|nr:SpoIIE family protein phosphatase [Anaerolineales bacterium]